MNETIEKIEKKLIEIEKDIETIRENKDIYTKLVMTEHIRDKSTYMCKMYQILLEMINKLEKVNK